MRHSVTCGCGSRGEWREHSWTGWVSKTRGAMKERAANIHPLYVQACLPFVVFLRSVERWFFSRIILLRPAPYTSPRFRSCTLPATSRSSACCVVFGVVPKYDRPPLPAQGTERIVPIKTRPPLPLPLFGGATRGDGINVLATSSQPNVVVAAVYAADDVPLPIPSSLPCLVASPSFPLPCAFIGEASIQGFTVGSTTESLVVYTCMALVRVRVRVHVVLIALSDLLREEEAGGGVVAPPREWRERTRREAVSDTEEQEFTGLCTRGSHPSCSRLVAMLLLLLLSRDVYADCGRVRRNTATGLRLRVAPGGEDMCTDADDAEDAEDVTEEVAEEEYCDLSNDDAFSDAGTRTASSRPPSPPR